MSWIEPVTDRTLYDIALAESYLRGHKTSVLPKSEPVGMKGFITLVDEERIAGNINYLAKALGLTPSNRTCFRDKETLLIDVSALSDLGGLLMKCEKEAIRQGLKLTESEKSGTNWFTWQDLNRVERVCKTIKEFIDKKKAPKPVIPSKPPAIHIPDPIPVTPKPPKTPDTTIGGTEVLDRGTDWVLELVGGKETGIAQLKLTYTPNMKITVGSGEVEYIDEVRASSFYNKCMKGKYLKTFAQDTQGTKTKDLVFQLNDGIIWAANQTQKKVQGQYRAVWEWAADMSK